MKILFQKLKEEAILPRRATLDSAGCDLHACLDSEVTVLPGETRLIPTGFAMAIPRGFGGFIFARSGLGVRHGMVPANCVGVIDADYRGEGLVALRNHSQTPYTVRPGERVAQMVVLATPMWESEETESLDETQRGAGGFGSTGRR